MQPSDRDSPGGPPGPRWVGPRRELPAVIRIVEMRDGASFVPPPLHHTPRQWAVAVLLFVATVGTTTTLGAVWMLWMSATRTTDLWPYLTPSTLARVWTDPELLSLGLAFALPALGILLCHELGHYLACRHYRLPATLPHFLPLPLGLGTLGAFIRIRAPIRTKRELFDVGVAGPIAGFVALLPFLFLGVAWSEPVAIERATDTSVLHPVLLLPGDNLALALVGRLLHGPLGPDEILQLHPFAVAAWFGLLATALNLIPLGQLDGGHILYAAVGPLQRRLAFPLWLGLVAITFLWLGWIVWCVVTLLMGLHHPPVRDEAEPLDRGRRWLAWLALLILAASFLPVPIEEVALR